MKSVMIDLETLGTTASSVIMSIGAVRFDLDGDTIDNAGFYASISIDSNLAYKRTISESTLVWWLQQSKEAQAVFSEAKQPLDAALEEFGKWFDIGRATDKVQIWSNGADFDIPMLAHAYAQIQMEAPWKFWASNCFRTYKKLPGAKAIAGTIAQGIALFCAQTMVMPGIAVAGFVSTAPGMLQPVPLASPLEGIANGLLQQNGIAGEAAADLGKALAQGGRAEIVYEA